MSLEDSPTVLLVDDRPENLLALEAVLQPLDCRTVTATSGEEALRRLLHDDFAVILLDVQMPGLDGFETAEYIKRRERTRDIPILFVTAINKERRHVFRGYAAGAVDYVFKPYDPEVLRAKVAVFLRLYTTSRALARSEAVLRAAFDYAPIGMARLDADGRILEANRALGQTVGVDAPRLAGRTLRTLLHPDDREPEARNRAALTGGLRGTYDDELRLLTPEGEAVPCQCSFSLASLAGHPDSVLVQIQDLRERRRAEAEREELVREQAARSVAERAARRLEAVQRLADAALGAQSVDGLVRDLLQRVGEVLAADAAAVVLVDPMDRAATVHRIDGTVAATLRSTAWELPDSGPVAEVLRTGAAAAIEDGARAAASGHPLGDAVRSLLAVPLRADSEVVGALLIGSLFPRTFGSEDVSVLSLAADRTGLAVQRLRRYEEEHAIATRLQRSLSPARLPAVPGMRTAARYSPAGAAAAEVGGDWYDAVGLPTGDLLLVMGDVAGRGVEAAAMMGQLRSAIRAYALHEASPGVLLDRLNAFQLSIAADTMATVLLARVSLDGTLVTTASAGHPPALVIGPDGEATWLRGGRGVPLGALDDPRYKEADHDVAPGSTLVLYTDGLVESRGEDLQKGLARLAGSVQSGPSDLEALCDHVLASAEAAPGSDDVSLLILRTVGAADDRFLLELPGDAPALAALRVTLRRWLASSEAEPDEVQDITMAVNEAVQNAIEHAHSFSARPFEVHLSREDGAIEAVVRDRGAWRRSGSKDRGRGILLMRALVDDVRIDRTDTGTVVTLRRALRAHNGTVTAAAAAASEDA